MALLQVDTKNRIALGKLLRGREVSAFDATVKPSGQIILTPMVIVPEHWIYKNKTALDSLQRGLADASAGKSRSLTEIRKRLKIKASKPSKTKD